LYRRHCHRHHDRAASIAAVTGRECGDCIVEKFERPFARQARISVTLAGISGFYMLWRLGVWERLQAPAFWWLHLMIALWILFVLMLFVLEPLGIDRLFRSYALRQQERAFALATRLHWAALLIATVTIGAGVLGAHGYLS
jgi:hypothetical protein